MMLPEKFTKKIPGKN